MTNVIDFLALVSDSNQPDRDCSTTDSEGHPVYLYAISYRLGERTYSVDIWARSREDADRHIEAMRRGLRLDGQVMHVSS